MLCLFHKIKDRRGSLTVEAALVMPIFMFCLINIISLFEMIYIHAVLDTALNQAGREISTYANMQDLYEVNLLTQAYVKERVVQIAGRERINNSPIVGGTAGIVLWRTKVEEENDVIDLVMTYRVEPWLNVYGIGEMTLINRCYIKAYTGYQQANILSEERKYYIAENGDVYHVSRICTHLQLSISEISEEELETARNMDGDRYTPCEICYDKMQEEDRLYIALQGERYHSSIACTGLKRTIYVVDESRVSGMPMCTRCIKENGIDVEFH